jgi:hypothetical protein
MFFHGYLNELKKRHSIVFQKDKNHAKITQITVARKLAEVFRYTHNVTTFLSSPETFTNYQQPNVFFRPNLP